MDAKVRYRTFLSIFFFLTGLNFSSWASRIPTLKLAFNLNEAELGNLLFIMPVASLAGLPISGFLVSRFDSRKPLTVAFILNAIALTCIGFSESIYSLMAAIFVFSFSMRILNISMNTQAITVQKMFDRNINGSFHGLWSTGGIAGVAISTLMISWNIPITIHLSTISLITIVTTFSSYRFLLNHDRSPSGNKIIQGKPDPFIFYLGVLAFLAAVCEGGMFDWSGIYFKEVIHEDIFTSGYLIFMTFMALSRFVSDAIIERIGMPLTYILSGLLIALGVALAVLLPSFWLCLIGFSLVGFGTASIFPLTFTLAGTSTKYSPGMCISIITTYAITGMLLGPPMIGYLAHAFGLQKAFISFIIAGLMMLPISQLFFRYTRRQQNGM